MHGQSLQRLQQTLKQEAKILLGKSVRIPQRITVDHTVLGSELCQWPIACGMISSDSVVYSFGVGEDVSFDLALIERFGCQLYAFDPTPKSVKWVRAQSFPPQFHFAELGLGGTSGEVSFRAPNNPDHVSYAASNASGETILYLHDLRSIMEKLGHRRVDVLKMDIEGSEYGVIRSLPDQGCLPGQLMVEFHHGLYGYKTADTKETVDTLLAIGYRPYYVSSTGREIGFVRSDYAARPD